MFNYLYSTICSTLTVTVTVSVYSSDPPWKDGNAGFTTVPLIKNVKDTVVVLIDRKRYRRGIDRKRYRRGIDRKRYRRGIDRKRYRGGIDRKRYRRGIDRKSVYFCEFLQRFL